MRLVILSSSSSGNCYLLESDTTALIIEAGVSVQKVKKALDFNVSKIAGCIISHSHGDHCGKVNDFLKAGIRCWVSEETNREIEYTSYKLCLLLEENHTTIIGEFKVLPFYVKHDVACFGFLIYHPECGKVLFLTDTYFSPWTFSGLNQILVEANYCEHILNENVEAGIVHPFVKSRTIRSHMSIETCKSLLRSNDLSQVNNIVLIHLSSHNSNAPGFKKAVEETTGKPVTIAGNGVSIEFNIKPF